MMGVFFNDWTLDYIVTLKPTITLCSNVRENNLNIHTL